MEGITPVVYTYHEDYSCPVQLDLYTPKGYSPSTTSYKTAIVYHGGGLAVGNRSLYIPQAVMTLLHQQDWIVISADYHLLPESTTANIYSDVEALEQWLLAHHHELGVNLDRITTIGASAGTSPSDLVPNPI
jgi:acetyl esterase/lipase